MLQIQRLFAKWKSHQPNCQVGRLCPVVAGGVCVGSLYWTCVTYGAVTVMQVWEGRTSPPQIKGQVPWLFPPKMFCALGSRTFWWVDLDGECWSATPSRLSTPCPPWPCSGQDGQCLEALMCAWLNFTPNTVQVKWQEPVLHFLRAHLPHLQITKWAGYV